MSCSFLANQVGSVVQLVRMLPCHGRGRGFESRPVRKEKSVTNNDRLFDLNIRTMPYYVYMLQSELDGSYYKGFTENPTQRLLQHNNGDSFYTSRKIPWKLVYIEQCLDKKTALIREKNLKKATTNRIEAIILSSKNKVDDFIG